MTRLRTDLATTYTKGMIRVVVADDSPLAREVIARALGGLSDVEVVGRASDGLEALDLCVQLTPDVLTLDLDMPHLDGRGVLAALKGESWAPSVVIVTAHAADAIELFELGAARVVRKPSPDGEIAGDLEPAVRAAASRHRERRRP